MRKTYTLNVEGKNSDRLLDAAKHDIRKYVKRERARVLPADVDFWDFDCSLGLDPSCAVKLHLASLITSVDTLVGQGARTFYVEVITKHGHRATRPAVLQSELAATPDENPAGQALPLNSF